MFIAAGCATLREPPQYVEDLQAYDVDPVVVAKMEEKKPLTIPDLIHLAEAEVPDDIAIAHIKRTRTVYTLEVDQIETLQNGGVGEELTNFLLATPNLYSGYRHRGHSTISYGIGVHLGHGIHPHYRFHHHRYHYRPYRYYHHRYHYRPYRYHHGYHYRGYHYH